ncbi:hypothetical protein QQ045_007261 [Rhodiola kirilowii]
MCSCAALIHFNPPHLRPRMFQSKSRKPISVFARLEKDTPSQSTELNLSVLRFTLGIPGLDESYLPRWLGYGFGSLLVLNHFAASSSITPAQLSFCIYVCVEDRDFGSVTGRLFGCTSLFWEVFEGFDRVRSSNSS